MNLGIFLALGDSFSNLKKSGQDDLFKRFYISYFAKAFTKVYIFSYENEYVRDLPENVLVIPNKFKLNRYLYAFLIPLLNSHFLFKCDVFRVYHLSGTIPAISSKIFLGKPFIFNFAYDYERFTKIEGKNIQMFLYKLLKPVAILFAYKIFVANRSILKKIPKIKAVFLPNGVDTDFFRPKKTKRKNKQSFSANKKPIVLSVGRLEKQKNLESLILAMRGIRANLLIVGRGSLKKKLENLAKIKKIDLKILDKVPHTKMPEIYNSADIFVLPSVAEGSPKALLEAMACGLPVICSNVEGTAEIIEDDKNGFLYGDANTRLSEKILALLDNHQLMEEISKNARKTVVKKFGLGDLNRIEVKSLKK